MLDIDILGVRVRADFSPPMEEEDLAQAGENFTQLKAAGYGGTVENDEFEDAMNQAGYMPSWISEEKRFVFVPLP